MKIRINEKGQAIAPETVPMDSSVFTDTDTTDIYWLGSAGIMIHSHHTDIMIDPVLEGFDMPLLYQIPIAPEKVEKLDGVLITHIDNDHFSRPTCAHVKDVCRGYHAPNYVADVMNEEGYPTTKHDIGDTFTVGEIRCTLTPAKHNWQNGVKKWQYRHWEEKDYCGYWMETEEGKIWLPGDSRLLESQLHMDHPDVILFDFADNEWHIGFEGAVRLADAYPDAKLLCIHWGSVDAPDMTPFNGNPERLAERIVNPERICVVAPGEKFELKKARHCI